MITFLIALVAFAAGYASHIGFLVWQAKQAATNKKAERYRKMTETRKAKGVSTRRKAADLPPDKLNGASHEQQSI